MPKKPDKVGRQVEIAPAKLEKIQLQMKRGRNPRLGFLHIPKTGGSGINKLGNEAARLGQPFPCSFGHAWRFAQIRRAFPAMRLAFILRDPLERTISGFNSRLRQGRPTYDSMWSPGEAAAFAHFRNVGHYLDAMIGDDELQRSASAFATKNIQHLRLNYGFYFRSVKFVKSEAKNFALIGRIEETEHFIDALCAEAGIAADKVTELYERRHESAVKSSNVLAAYSDGDIAKMRAALADDYAIYDELLKLSQPPRPTTL